MKFGKLSTSVTLESFNNGPKPSVGLFYYGCNFKCGYCHNHVMLGDVNENELMTEEHLKKVLSHAKKTWKKMVVVGGGEPTLSSKLFDLLKYLKYEWEFEIKLDTNGSRPDVLKKLIKENLVDYIAMDIKGSKDQYSEIAKYSEIEKINESIKIIKNFHSYEFRTTVLPNIHDVDTFKKIGEWIKGADLFYLQQFRPDLANGCLDESYCLLKKPSKEELKIYSEAIKPFVKQVKIR